MSRGRTSPRRRQPQTGRDVSRLVPRTAQLAAAWRDARRASLANTVANSALPSRAGPWQNSRLVSCA